MYSRIFWGALLVSVGLGLVFAPWPVIITGVLAIVAGICIIAGI